MYSIVCLFLYFFPINQCVWRVATTNIFPAFFFTTRLYTLKQTTYDK